MKRENIRQFKLVSGEEILCEIIEWDNDVSEEIIVRNIYNIVSEVLCVSAEMSRKLCLSKVCFAFMD